jgi:hypothetical protein
VTTATVIMMTMIIYKGYIYVYIYIYI